MIVSGVFDIETEGWDQFVLGGFFDERGYVSLRDEDDFFDYLCEQAGTLWTFNGGRFDMNWFLDVAKRRRVSCEVSIAGSRITNLKPGKGLVIRDLAALMPFMALAEAATIAGIELDKDTGLRCQCQSDCGGYCAIRRGMSDLEYRRLDNYLRADCEATWKTAHALATIAEECNYMLTATIGGSTWKTAKTQLDIPDADWDLGTYFDIQEASFGGRCQVIRPRWEGKAHAYDINSAYPAALFDLALPVGAPSTIIGAKARRAYARRRPGFYLAEVFVAPGTFLPPLPVKHKTRIAYPTGAFRGSWALEELAYAQSVGVRVEILEAIVFPEVEKVFRPYMERVWANRAAATIPALKLWHKTIGNSLTGKLGEGPDRARYYVHPDPARVKDCTRWQKNRYCTGAEECENCSPKFCCVGHCGSNCNGWRPIDRDGVVYGAPYFLIPGNSHVHWAATLRAHTRVAWHKMAVSKNGGADLLYGDTDSIYSIDERTENVGTELGQWKYEGAIADFRAIAPKAYEYTRDHGLGVACKVVRAKGLSGIDWRDFDRFARGESIVVSRGVKGFRSAARSGRLFQRKVISRSNKQDGRQFGDRLLGDDGRTYPVDAGEIGCLK